MSHQRAGVLVAALSLLLAAAASGEVAWPPGELSRRVQAYFAHLRGSEADARRFLAEDFAAPALADAPLDERLRRRAMMLERTSGLTPLEVVESGAATMSVRCRAGNGDDLLAIFEAEPSPPHKLLGVRLEAGEHGGGPPRGPSGPPLTASELAAEARAFLDERAAAGGFSGVALIVRGDSTLLSGAWGLADRGKGTPITLETRFNLASIGKLLTRAAVAQLAEQGRLSLDDKLEKYLPGFPNADRITLEMLAEHRSGVGDIFNAKYQAMDRSKLRHNRDYLELIRDQPLWFEPGQGQRYSNGGYVLLGEVIAKASGEDYYDYLAKHVFAAAGMKSTGAPVEGDGTPGLARGYTREGAAAGGETDNAATRPARGSAAGGLYSTAADLLAFDRALLSGRLCSRAWAGWVAEGERPDRRPPGAGATPAAAEPPGAGMAFGFGGGAPGVSTEWSRIGDAVIIVLTNRDPEVSEPTRRGLQDLLRRLKPAPKRRPRARARWRPRPRRRPARA
jgi:CubicO group peptidase (beta-lactamase class C family)